MLLQEVFLENATIDLHQMVERAIPRPFNSNFRWDNYIAMSLVQKSIRRGNIENALVAGDMLLKFSERNFWKRLCVCAVEDVGVANPKLVAQTLITANDKRFRDKLGGADKVAQALLVALCESPKDRCADDLIDAISNASLYSELKANLAEMSLADVAKIVVSKEANIQVRAIAAVQLATGWDDFSSDLRKGHRWNAVLDELSEEIASPCITAISQLGIRRTGSLLAPFLTLIYANMPKRIKYADDFLPDSVEIAGLPSWALDGHTRSGLQSFRIYIQRSQRMKNFLSRNATREVSPSKTVAGLVFRYESGQLVQRLDWKDGRKLKLEACANRPGLLSESVLEGLSILHSEFELLNECRIAAMRDYFR